MRELLPVVQTDRETLERWCVEHAVTRDEELRARIVEHHQWLVLVCARQMRRRNESMEDLVQVANVGLLQAIDRFDPSFGVSFRTFASATISGVLRRHYRATWRMKVPRRLQETHLAVAKSIDVLNGDLQRSPTIGDVARYLHISEDDVLEAIEAGINYWPEPLPASAPIDASALAVDGVLGAHDSEYDNADDRAEIRELLALLPSRQRAILYLHFFEEHTQAEIAEQLGVSQVHVSRLMRTALAQLRVQHPDAVVHNGHSPAFD